MRTLYYIPALHTHEESGTECCNSCKVDPQVIKEENVLLEACWGRVTIRIQALLAKTRTPYRKVHVFADGIPRLKKKIGRVWLQPVAGTQSPTYKFIVGMVKRGATTHGTEDLGLLMATEEFFRQGHRLQPTRRGLRQRLLIGKRDAFVAATINEDVPDGEVAVCMMGARHRVDRELLRLDPTWRIIRLRHFLRELPPYLRRRHSYTLPRRKPCR